MIGLLIVDDEPMVRYGIRTAIPWQQHGVEVVGEAGNGRAAMEMVGRLRPDVVLLDIVMPVEDGITFVQKLRNALPDIRVIMITGHADASYMVEAIHSCVKDYLLKPASAQQILESVIKVRDEIERERAQLKERKGREDIFAENLALLRAHFTENLLSGRLSPEKIQEGIRLLALPLVGPQYAFVLAMSPSDDVWHLAQQLAALFAPYAPLIARLPQGNVVVSILNLDAPLDAARLSLQSTARFSGSAHLTGAMILSGAVDSLEALAPMFQPGIKALGKSFWYDVGSLIPLGDMDASEFPVEAVKALEYKLFDAIQEGDPADIRRCAQHLMDRLLALKPPKEDFEQLMGRVEQTVNALCRSPDAPPLPRPGAVSADAFRDAFIAMCCQGKSGKRDLGTGQLGRALRYIEHNCISDISLEGIAAQLYLSPTYLSRLLNEKTELGFYGWLHYFRVEKARELLTHTQMKHYEIAQAVGYRSYKAFSEHFQRITGCTAGEYRQRVHGSRTP